MILPSGHHGCEVLFPAAPRRIPSTTGLAATPLDSGCSVRGNVCTYQLREQGGRRPVLATLPNRDEASAGPHRRWQGNHPHPWQGLNCGREQRDPQASGDERLHDLQAVSSMRHSRSDAKEGANPGRQFVVVSSSGIDDPGIAYEQRQIIVDRMRETSDRSRRQCQVQW